MPPMTASKELRYVIIGAGMAGLLAAIKLMERGETNFVVYEKGSSVGGTWRENRYPGIACDTPAHSYTYSFAYNPDWSAYYAPGAEIRQYFQDMAKRYGLASHIEFDAEVTSCTFAEGRWRIGLSGGRQDIADIVVAATGVLHHPSYPDIPGLENFRGQCFHSARWKDDVIVDDRRIGVIGGGSTGVQIISALSRRAARLVHLVRSPQWIMPCPDTRYSDEERMAFRDDPSLIEAVRSGPDAAARRARFTAAIIDMDSPELAEIQEIVERNLELSVRDPELREKLRPGYRAACKRLVFSPNYYEAVQQPGVTVDTGAIAQVEANGIRMTDGTLHELDLLVLATGFKVDQFVRPIKFTGEDGCDLDTFWSPNPRAYYAVTVPNFPNFFLLNGPTGPVGNFSLIDIAEAQWGYIDQLLDLIRTGQCSHVAPALEALTVYERERTEASRKTVFASGCRSWYLDAEGTPAVWPWSYAHFTSVMAKPRLEDYELTDLAVTNEEH